MKKATNVEFSTAEECKYQTRFENGYDLPDERYIQWLQLRHPSAAQKLSSKHGMWMGASVVLTSFELLPCYGINSKCIILLPFISSCYYAFYNFFNMAYLYLVELLVLRSKWL